jgi:hypothetical protein
LIEEAGGEAQFLRRKGKKGGEQRLGSPEKEEFPIQTTKREG